MSHYHQHSREDKHTHNEQNKSNINITQHNNIHHKEDHSDNLKKLKMVFLIMIVFSFIELIGAIQTHSLALLSDFSHMLTDSLSLIIAISMSLLSIKPANNKFSYGHGRADTIGALINSLFMIGIIIFILYEGIHRIFSPHTVNGLGVLFIAFIGFVVNLISFKILHSGHNHSLNNKAALIHVLGDLLGSLIAMIAGICIYFTGYYLIDPILSILVSIVMFFPTIKILKSSFKIIMEGVPEHIVFEKVGESIEKIEKVKSVHDLHIWTMDSQDIALTAHVVIPELNSWDAVLEEIQLVLLKEYNISHVTIQPEKEIF